MIKHNSTIYEPFKTDLFSGYVEVDIPAGQPSLRWHGPKIKPETWAKLLAFFCAHPEHEVQARFVINEARTAIDVVVHSQEYGTGMTTKENDDPELREYLSKNGWDDIGTIHTHCNMAAFQSGTDHKDEVTQQGLHITVGKLKEARLDIHARAVVCVPGVQAPDGSVARPARRAMVEPILSDWFELPSWIPADADAGLAHMILMYQLLSRPPQGTKYPDWWKDKLVERKAVVVSGQGYGGHPFFGNNLPPTSMPVTPAQPSLLRFGISEWHLKQFNEVLEDFMFEINKLGLGDLQDLEDIRFMQRWGDQEITTDSEDPVRAAALREAVKLLEEIIADPTVHIGMDTFWRVFNALDMEGALPIDPLRGVYDDDPYKGTEVDGK